MKKLIIILFVLPFIMTSCSKSYDDPDIVGTWMGDDEVSVRLVIKSNGKYSLLMGDNHLSGKYEYYDNKLMLETEFGPRSLKYDVTFYTSSKIYLYSGDCEIPGSCITLFKKK